MSDGIVEYGSKSFEERLAYYNDKRVVEISNGLGALFFNADELIDFTLDELMKNKGRIPFIGTKDGKIFMIGGKAGIQSHKAIVDEAKINLEDVEFSLALEGIDPNPPAHYCYIELDTKNYGTVKIKVRPGSDLNVPGIGVGGKKYIENTLKGILGVTIHVAPLFDSR